MLLMADLYDLDRAIGDKSGEWFVRHGPLARTIMALPPGGDPSMLKAPAMVDAFDPTLFIFDAYPGGIGFSELLFKEHERLLLSAQQLLCRCSCTHGCPSCVGPTLEVGVAAKETALAILASIL
jgi:DEAD/DEAH box helicase domain-containing protein